MALGFLSAHFLGVILLLIVLDVSIVNLGGKFILNFLFFRHLYLKDSVQPALP